MIARSHLHHPDSSAEAYSRVDLAVTMAVVALLLAVILPGLAQTGSRSEQIVCSNNLRMIGRALQIWGNEHTAELPWRTVLADGGTMVSPKLGNVWYELSWVSNELATPRILACPGDAETRVARDFSRSSDGGFLHQNFRGNAVSYFIGLDVFSSTPGALAAGDRNLKVSWTGVPCSSGVNNAAEVNRDFEPSEWTNSIHGEMGNVLSFDGRVQYISTDNMGTLGFTSFDVQGRTHILFPR